MKPTQVFAASWKQSAIGIVLCLGLGAGALAFTLQPETKPGSHVLGFVLIAVLALCIVLFVSATASTKLILESEGLVWNTPGKSVRVRWDQIDAVWGHVTDGSANTSSHDYIVLNIPDIAHISGARGGLGDRKSQLWIGVDLFDAGAGVILEAIKERSGLEPPKAPSAGVSRRIARVRQGVPRRFSALAALVGVPMFGVLAGTGVVMALRGQDDRSLLIVGLVFAVFFGAATATSLLALLGTKLELGEEGIRVRNSGMDVAVPWSEVIGVQYVGADLATSPSVVIVNLADFQAFVDKLKPAQHRKVLNLLAGRGEGIPIQTFYFLTKPSNLVAQITAWIGD